ncbi:MAG: hypothetical protein JXJ04_04000 [Spirochaetales bacterium]|nr:hypothetical protein [Spirochaetales bacterium]
MPKCKKNDLSRKVSLKGSIQGESVSFLFVLSFILLFIVTFPINAEISLDSILRQSTYSTGQKDSIIALFKEAAEKGIPSPLLLPRLEEGVAKKVPYEKLMIVLSREISFLEQARDLLESLDKTLILADEPLLWLRTGLLFSKGVPREIIVAIASKSIQRWDDFREATSLYLSLEKWGLSEQEALLVVESVLASGLPGQDFMGIISIFTQGRSLYISPKEIIERIEEVIGTINTIEDLEDRILY